MWLNLQAIHDLRKVEDEAGDAIRAQVTPPRRAG
jgi:plasmid maintenance system antidote protein VapI